MTTGDSIRSRTALRDTGCGLVTVNLADTEIRLVGWVHRRRDLGAVRFVDLRDRYGLVQLSFGMEWSDADVIEAARELNPEDVISVRGIVRRRPDEAVNAGMATGEIEVQVTAIERLSVSKPLPILVAVPPEEELPSEELRLRHRVLDLRRPEMIRNFEIRHRTVAAARASLGEEGFLEVETPLLTRKTPEGARDYLVPSRIHDGEFYALPQSPQLYKQLLMVAGFDRYFQVVKCLRDEDLRSDRQPEFTQVDAEMSFVDEEDVFGVCERMVARMFRDALGHEISTPFRRMTHSEAMEMYGTDKPDLRIPWKISDVTELLTGIGFGIFDGAAEAGGRVRAIRVPGGEALSRSRLDAANEMARANGAKGALWLKRRDDAWSGPPAKFVDEVVGARLESELGVEPGDLLILVAGVDDETSPALDALRRGLGAELGAATDGLEWLWVTDFPLFDRDRETGQAAASHHPFTAPAVATAGELLADPFSVVSRAYDLIVDGTELLSGSIRCHDPEMQHAILTVLGLTPDEIEARFGFLLEAFRYGAPPHGGFALGLDRLVAIMVGAGSIREVIAFPKTAAARGLMEGSPSPIEPSELAELGIQVVDSPASGRDEGVD